jgi:ankyrin repeat protein
MLWGNPEKASEEKDIKPIIQQLIDAGANVNARTQSGISVLNTAVSLSFNEIVLLLLKSGADPNANVPSLTIVAQTGNEKIISLLLENGANPNAERNDGLTPLIAALLSDIPEKIVPLLIKGGAKIDAPNRQGMTVLLTAAFEFEPKDVSMLLKNGADPKIKSKEGNTAFDFALRNEKFQGTKELEQLRSAVAK